MTGTPPSAASPPTAVKAIRNGPLQLKGSFRLLDPDGDEYDLDGQRIVLLCRCGRSKNQPFCDASHARDGFTTQDRPACDELDDETDGEIGNEGVA